MAEKRAEGGNDASEDAEALVDGKAVGNKTADVLRSAGGFWEGRIKLRGRVHDALPGGLHLPFCRPFPLLQGNQDVGGIEYAAHETTSSSSSSS